MNRLRELAKRINSYTSGEVTRAQVEDVLDFNILLEPNPMHPAADAQFEMNVIANKSTIEKGNAIVRQFGRQLPPDLGKMQDVFYSFTNSDKYRQSMITISVARTVLSSNWDGIGPWRE